MASAASPATLHRKELSFRCHLVQPPHRDPVPPEHTLALRLLNARIEIRSMPWNRHASSSNASKAVYISSNSARVLLMQVSSLLHRSCLSSLRSSDGRNACSKKDNRHDDHFKKCSRRMRIVLSRKQRKHNRTGRRNQAQARQRNNCPSSAWQPKRPCRQCYASEAGSPKQTGKHRG